MNTLAMLIYMFVAILVAVTPTEMDRHGVQITGWRHYLTLGVVAVLWPAFIIIMFIPNRHIGVTVLGWSPYSERKSR